PVLLGQELAGDARALTRDDAVTVPRLVAAPRLVKPAALAVRRGQTHHAAAADGQHRADGVVQGVVHARRLVHDEQRDARVAAHILLIAWESHDAAAVCQG